LSDFHFASRVVRFEIVIAGGIPGLIQKMEKRRVAFAAFRHRKAGKKSFSGFYSEKRERISEARKLAHPFFLYFWGQKYKKKNSFLF